MHGEISSRGRIQRAKYPPEDAVKEQIFIEKFSHKDAVKEQIFMKNYPPEDAVKEQIFMEKYSPEEAVKQWRNILPKMQAKEQIFMEKFKYAPEYAHPRKMCIVSCLLKSFLHFSKFSRQLPYKLENAETTTKYF